MIIGRYLYLLLIIGIIAASFSVAADSASGVEPVTVAEVFFTQPFPEENIDSPAVWLGKDGRHWLLVTAKNSHMIHIYDARDGCLIRKFGSFGAEPGQFSRPNGIWVDDDALYVVERDNGRVQLFSLPELAHLGYVGEGRLRKPYGIYVQRLNNNIRKIYVTDNYEVTQAGSQPAPGNTSRNDNSAALAGDKEADSSSTTAGFDQRVWLFIVTISDGQVTLLPDEDTPSVQCFGANTGKGVLQTVESLYGDPLYDRLLIADEAENAHTIKVYTMKGEFTGSVMGEGIFQHEPEGIALYQGQEGSGCWIAADQGPDRTVFHLFDRKSLIYKGSFQGQDTKNTDGIWLSANATNQFPSGVFYAVDDDARVAAFSWQDIGESASYGKQ